MIRKQYLTKKRPFSIYQKINEEQREKLIESVLFKGIDVKIAAEEHKINLSTAKTILRTFKLEKRISKKKQAYQNHNKSNYFRFRIVKIKRNRSQINNKTDNRIDVSKNKYSIFNLSEKQNNSLKTYNSIKFVEMKIAAFQEVVVKFKELIISLLSEVEFNNLVIQNLLSFPMTILVGNTY